jgi:hypothetical protein
MVASRKSAFAFAPKCFALSVCKETTTHGLGSSQAVSRRGGAHMYIKEVSSRLASTFLLFLVQKASSCSQLLWGDGQPVAPI